MECRSLAAHGYDVALIACHDSDEISDGVRIVAIKKPTNRLVRFGVTTFRVMIAALSQKDIRLYHIHDPELLPVGTLLRLLGRTVVYDMHENVPKDISDKHWLPRWIRPLVSVTASVFERLFLRSMPIVFAETSYRDDYPFVRTHCTVRNMPFIFAAGKRSLTPTVGYMGSVSRDRGIDTIFDAIELLARRNCPITFECVGEISTELSNELAIEERELAPATVNLHGYLPPRYGWKIISHCHIGLAILKPRPNFVGSYPTKMFEYMSFGIPVIVSNFPYYREIVETHRCGLCIDPHSPEALADAIQWLQSCPEEAAAMGRRGRAAVENEFNWDSEFGKLREFYSTLLSSSGNPCREVRSSPMRRVA
jgi:glycosyltransferase involved in cell wall biosynthesis